MAHRILIKWERLVAEVFKETFSTFVSGALLGIQEDPGVDFAILEGPAAEHIGEWWMVEWLWQGPDQRKYTNAAMYMAIPAQHWSVEKMVKTYSINEVIGNELHSNEADPMA